MNEEVLVHHGVKGQRWGVITKAYVPKGTHSAKTDQNKKGSKIQQRVQARLAKRRNAKLAKRQAKLPKKLKANKQATNDDAWDTLSVEQKKKMILQTKSAKVLYNNSDLFDSQELRDAYNRLQTLNNISEMASTTEKSKAENMRELVDNATKYANTAVNAMQTVNNVYAQATLLQKNLNKMFPEEVKK